MYNSLLPCVMWRWAQLGSSTCILLTSGRSRALIRPPRAISVTLELNGPLPSSDMNLSLILKQR